MKRTLTKAAVTAALIAGTMFALPTAASATYDPPATGTVSDSTVAPGEAFTFSVEAGAFEPGETVSISLTGENASGASLGFVKFAVETNTLGTATAAANGGLNGVKITLPSNASGTYRILATSPSNPVGASATVTVSGAGTGDSDDDDNLATTGPNSEALLGLWVGGGALVLVGGGVAVATAVRRNRGQASAA